MCEFGGGHYLVLDRAPYRKRDPSPSWPQPGKSLEKPLPTVSCANPAVGPLWDHQSPSLCRVEKDEPSDSTKMNGDADM